MSLAYEIKTTLEKALNPTFLEIINESDKHIGHAGHDGSGESHFKLLVVSVAFEGQPRPARHRLVMDPLKSMFDKGLHALSIEAFTPQEFHSQK